MRNSRILAAAVLTLALLAACGGSQSAPTPGTPTSAAPTTGAPAGEPGPLEGSWTVRSLGDQPVPEGVEVTMVFQGEQVSGNAGCNSYSADVTADDEGHMSFGPIRSTLMMCQGPAAETETPFLTAMEKVSGYQGGDSQTQMMLVDEGGAALIEIEKAA